MRPGRGERREGRSEVTTRRLPDVWPWRALAVALAMTSAAGADDDHVPIALPCGGTIEGVVRQPVAASADTMLVASDLFSEPIELPTSEALRSTEAEREATGRLGFPGLPERVGLLTAGGTRMLGCLADCADGRVGWQPLGGARPVAFAGRQASVRIDYRGLDAVGGAGVVVARHGADDWEVVDVPDRGPAGRQGRPRVGERVTAIAEGASGHRVDLSGVKADAVKLLLVGPIGSVVRLVVARDEGSEEVAITRDASGLGDLAGAAAKDVLDRSMALQQSLAGAAARGPATVHLRTGESLACTVLTADEAWLTVRRADQAAITIPLDGVKAVELSQAGVRPILKQKLSRLLTVPRDQRATPPTHVVRMTSGDYLRGRLTGLDADTIRFDVAGDSKPLPRRDVARIISLAPAGESPACLPDALDELGGLPIVVVGGDGRRQAVAAHGIHAGAVVGVNPVLGATTVPLGGAATVLIGAAIDEVPAADLPYAQWELTPAADPKAAATR